MLLKDIFQKPVDRVIEGVIKADDDHALKTEIEEYVLTKEVAKHLESLLHAYNNYAGANGVWISGFFGSGKSHLLKMLSFLLENKEIEGERTLDKFLPKCEGNALLSAELKKAVNIPSRSILFNIDQKANVISKAESEALIAVFVKVFDEACGYFGNQPYIAQFERELDREKLLDKFKQEFKVATQNRVDWEKGRERDKRYAEQIDQAYNAVTKQDHTGVLDKYRDDYSLSIEDFAHNVNDYIKAQERGFRLNFFVDEVGQYVADNVKLMTNLQTVAESLATICNGRAWLIVTAQEEMTSILGDEAKKVDRPQSDDFSKIQGRFKNRMKLTSADVDEVIRKRLLQKKESAEGLIKALYDNHRLNFKTMFDFVDGSKRYKNFENSTEFISNYPFIPYQFPLFQQAIINLSTHSAFEGRHSSVGERSMLAVFQVVAKQMGEEDLGNIASFDLMFEGIRTTLKTNIQSSINVAEKNLDSQFAIKLLKALFLVKYIKEFKSTLRNITVLMLTLLDQDIGKLTTQIEVALNILEAQSYIQRNGNEYEFLTDDEKDVEKEIKSTDIEVSEVINEFHKIIFDDILKKNKIRFPDNSQDYSYTKKLDGTQFSSKQELTIHLVTPQYEFHNDETTLLMHSMEKDELIVLMPDDGRIFKDMQLYKRTQKYIRQNASQGQSANITRILTDKANQNRIRKENLQATIETLLATAKMFINGSELSINEALANTRIENGFHELVRITYPNLKMVTGSYSLGDIQITLDEEFNELKREGLSEAHNEILGFIKLNQKTATRASLKAILNKFETKPYGWDQTAIICLVTQLYKYEKIEVLLNSEALETYKISSNFTNSAQYDKLIIHPLVEFNRTQIKNLQAFYDDFFNDVPATREARGLAIDTKDNLKAYIDQVERSRNINYPFNQVIDSAIALFKSVQAKAYSWFLTDFANKDSLIDTKVDITDPIIEFMQEDNSQRIIYDKAKTLIAENNTNLTYVDGDKINQIEEIIGSPNCLQGNKIKVLNDVTEELRAEIIKLVEEERITQIDKIKALEEKLKEFGPYEKLSAEQKAEIKQKFVTTYQELEQDEYIATIRDKGRTFEDKQYDKIIRDIELLTTPKAETKAGEVKKELSISKNKLKVDYDKFFIEDETDLENYLDSLKSTYKSVLAKGTKIRVQ